MSAKHDAGQSERRARAAHTRGLRLLGRGWSIEAARCFAEAVALHPERVESWDALAAALAEGEDAAGALRAQLEAVQRAPERLDLLLNLGTLLHALGPTLATEALTAATADPDLATEAHLTLGLLHADQGRPRQARAHLERALGHEANDPEALQELAAVQLDLSEPKEAIGTLRRALEIAPEAAELWLDLARAYVNQGLITPAREALGRAETLGAPGPELAVGDAQIALLEQDPDRAIASLARAFGGSPSPETGSPPEPLPAEILDDPAFDTLREHPDFQALYPEPIPSIP